MVKIKKATKKLIVGSVVTLLVVGFIGTMFGFVDLSKIKTADLEVPDFGDLGNVADADGGIPDGYNVQLTGATMTAAFVDEYERGNEFVPDSIQFRPVGGGSWSAITSGTTTATPGNCYDFYATNSTSLNDVYLGNKCAPYANSWVLGADEGFIMTVTATAPTIRIWDDGGVLLTDNGTGATAGNNQTMASAETATLKFEIQGESEKSTNPIRCVLENNGTVIKEASLIGTGATKIGTGKPQIYNLESTQSITNVYDLPAIKDGAIWSGYYRIESKTGQDASASFSEVVCFDKQHYIDADTGAIALNVENTAGTAQNKISGFDYRVRFD